MSAHLIELIIYAGIAFFIINKLISTLGMTSDDDPSQKKTFFGEHGRIKDVTPIKTNATILKPNFTKKTKTNLKGLIVTQHEEEIRGGLLDITNKMPSFNIEKFINGAKAAFKMIITASSRNNEAELEELIDPRYMELFKEIAPSYGNYIDTPSNFKAQISEIFMFGNNAFIKILFVGKNITDKVKELHEEWTFTKNTLNNSPEWYLTNIERPQ